MARIIQSREIPVKVDVICIEALGIGNEVPSRPVGSVGVGQGIDPDPDAVDQPGDLAVLTLPGDQVIDQAQHEHIPRNLVTVHA